MLSAHTSVSRPASMNGASAATMPQLSQSQTRPFIDGKASSG
jgi:hypothetical protein